MLLGENGRNYYIKQTGYTNGQPFAKWLYWVMIKEKGEYHVLKVCTPKEQSK